MGYYRFESSGLGIYEAVERNCPRTDLRRSDKPDGSWLPRVGEKYPGATSYWTEFGLQQYLQSGLQAWHCSVIPGPVTILKLDQPREVLYRDPYQIICAKNQSTVEVSLDDIL